MKTWTTALLLFLPNLLWQFAHGWPTVAFAVNLNRTTMAGIGRVDFLLHLIHLSDLLFRDGIGRPDGLFLGTAANEA